MTYFGRRIVVDVAGLTISEPRINVLVERQSDSTQTNGHVDIYNLSDGHAQLIYDRGTTITVQAGYPTTLATIYQGAVQRVIKGRQQLGPHYQYQTRRPGETGRQCEPVGRRNQQVL